MFKAQGGCVREEMLRFEKKLQYIDLTCRHAGGGKQEGAQSDEMTSDRGSRSVGLRRRLINIKRAAFAGCSCSAFFPHFSSLFLSLTYSLSHPLSIPFFFSAGGHATMFIHKYDAGAIGRLFSRLVFRDAAAEFLRRRTICIGIYIWPIIKINTKIKDIYSARCARGIVDDHAFARALFRRRTRIFPIAISRITTGNSSGERN